MSLGNYSPLGGVLLPHHTTSQHLLVAYSSFIFVGVDARLSVY